ncbi:MAG: methylmalonyl-CoA carboxyltransferase [Chloroflexi bacterium]|nr:methylmalonyl-CoA carboxyltransferase [Chloroflexota bacterium]|tara:strand:- start:727 stop:2283 length:1557 start_codon:yes stop_codon:yes gene_type:complete
MVWEPEINELEKRRELAYRMGTEDRVKRHHDRGHLTVRERIALLVDSGSFRERGVLAGKAHYENSELKDFIPSNYVMGVAKLDGRPAVVGGDDFTVRGGAADGAVGGKAGHAEKMARELRIPVVRMVDGTGGGGSVKTIEDIGRTYIPGNTNWDVIVEAMSEIPMVATAMGSIAGIGAARVAASHFSIMIKGNSQVFIAGPPVVERAFGQPIDKEELGGSAIHAHGSGVVDNEVDTEEEAFELIRKFLSYLPSNSWEVPPIIESTDPTDRRDDDLLSVIPKDRRKPHDIRALLGHILDRDSFFEIAPHFGPSLVVGLARLGGFSVGVIANDPRKLGGSMDGPASDKFARFIDLFDTFNLPVINFVDQPGFMLGTAAENSGVARRGVRALAAVNQAVIPWASVVIRRAFGVAGAGHQNHSRWNYRVAWPSGDWGSLPIEGGVMAAYRREIEEAEDPERRREEIETRLNELRSPFRTAESFNIEDIIDPRDTRPLLCEWIELAYKSLPIVVGPKFRGTRP